MKNSGKQHFLIDGFPRNEENRAAFESQVSNACMLWSSNVGQWPRTWLHLVALMPEQVQLNSLLYNIWNCLCP